MTRIPGLRALATYRASWLRHDLVADLLSKPTQIGYMNGWR